MTPEKASIFLINKKVGLFADSLGAVKQWESKKSITEINNLIKWDTGSFKIVVCQGYTAELVKAEGIKISNNSPQP